MTLGCDCNYRPGSNIRPRPVPIVKPRAAQLSGLGAGSPVSTISTLVANKSSGTVGSVASGVAVGATVGSVVPVVGTVIGGIVGGVVGAIKGIFGNHDVRVSGADKSTCQALVNNYLSVASQNGGIIGHMMQLAQLEQVHFCLAALYGVPIYNVDPRFFGVDITQSEQLAQQLVAGALAKGPGGTFSTTAVTGAATDSKHSSYTYGAQSVTLPNPLSVASLGALLAGLMNDNCAHRNKYPSNCPAYWHNAGFSQLCTDLIAFYLKGNAFAAASVPGGNVSAVPPVTAVTMPAAAPPVVSAPAPVTAVPMPVVTVSPPTIATSTPAIKTSADMAALSAALQAQGASQSQAYQAILSQLAAQGSQITPAVQQAAQVAASAPVTAGGGFDTKTVLIGGGIALLAFLFATARPAR
jgi:hypothetical protein